MQIFDEGVRTKWLHPYNYDPIPVFQTAGDADGRVYSDRLFQWNHTKHDELCQKHFGNIHQYWDKRSPADIQAFLRDYLDLPNLKLLYIEEQCNQATGFPLWRFDYKRNE
jgi:hypothetical protein